MATKVKRLVLYLSDCLSPGDLPQLLSDCYNAPEVVSAVTACGNADTGGEYQGLVEALVAAAWGLS